MSYSKGKWNLDPLTGEVHTGGSRVAKVFGATEFNREKNASECQANAMLILNAPEMYVLLKTLVASSNDVEVGAVWLAAKKLLAHIDGEEAEA